jgi:ketosteroid isomerase-like protein
MEEPGNTFPDMQSHWQIPNIPPPVSQGMQSATDLLGWWFHAPQNVPNPWDVYLNHSFPSFDHTVSNNTINKTDNMKLPMAPWAEKLENLQPLDNEPDYSNDADAEMAVDCLYEFIHAFGNNDVESAMQLVDEDYHVFEEDKDIDRLGLRHQLESRLDSLRGWDIELSLSKVPEPIFHPNGILIYIEIQIDARRAEDNQTQSEVEKRIAVFKKQKDGTWKIFALSPI